MGKLSRDKGARGERELVRLFRSWGLKAERVPLSGATTYANGDVDVYPKGRNAPFVVECKTRATGFKQLYTWLGDYDVLAVKADRKDRLYVIPERVLRKLIT